MGRAQEKPSQSGPAAAHVSDPPIALPAYKGNGTPARKITAAGRTVAQTEGPGMNFWHEKMIMYENSGQLNKQKVQSSYTGEYC